MEPKSSPTVVLVTASSQQEAGAIARAIVTQKLAACVNVFPVQSTYTWGGAVQQEEEWQLVIKTDLACWDELNQAIQSLHSYDVPELIALPIAQGSEAYLSWLAGSVKS